jgi:hypothetical protein
LGLRAQTRRSPDKSGAKPGHEHATCWPLIPPISRNSSRSCVDAVARVMADRDCHFAFHPIIGRDRGQRVLSPLAMGGDTRPRSPIPGRWIGLSSLVIPLVLLVTPRRPEQSIRPPRRARRTRRSPSGHSGGFPPF